MAKRTTSKGDRARARIVSEAARIFAKDGFRSGSLARIAEAAGLTQQGLLHYFPTKAALLLAVIADRNERTGRYLEEQARSDNRLDRFVDGVRRNAEEPHLVELMTVLSAESTSPDHPSHDWFVRSYEDRVDQLAAGVVEEQRAGRWLTDMDPVMAARVLIALADGLRLQRLLGQPDLDHPAVLADMLGRLRSGLRDGAGFDE